MEERIKLLPIDKCKQCYFYYSWYVYDSKYKYCKYLDEYLQTENSIPYWCQLPNNLKLKNLVDIINKGD